jgi:hypothetical protein
VSWCSASFYRNLYDGARQEAETIQDREKLAAYWIERHDWFSSQLTINAQEEQVLKKFDIPVPRGMSDTLDALNEIVEACKNQYELYVLPLAAGRLLWSV